MGSRSTLIPDAAAIETDASGAVTGDQAVFTSVRSPTGEGYRLVAASAGVRAEEKVEITRRSPSHDNLCGSGAGAVGLSSYLLSSGRHCVGYVCHAGCEHTAGGHGQYYDNDDATRGGF